MAVDCISRQYHYLIPACDTRGEHENRLVYIWLINIFYSDAETAVAVDVTPGVRILVGEFWRKAVCIPYHAGMGPVCDLLVEANRLDFESGEADAYLVTHIDELIEGAGGSMEDLATLVVEHIKLVRVDPAHWLPTLQSVLIFLRDAHYRMLVWPAHFKFAGLADALISSVDTFIADDGDRCESTLELYFEMLIWVIDDNIEYLTDALKAELLAAIISCCRAHLYISTIMSFLEHHLQSLTVYHSVLRELRKLSTASVPETSPMFKQWKAFVDLVNERAAFMDSFDSDEYDALRACDSLEVRPCPQPQCLLDDKISVRHDTGKDCVQTMRRVPAQLLLLKDVPARGLARRCSSRTLYEQVHRQLPE
jgi:hypothetical protein